MIPNNVNGANRACTASVLGNINRFGILLVPVREANAHPTGLWVHPWINGGGFNVLWIFREGLKLCRVSLE